MTRLIHLSLASLVILLLVYCLHFNVDIGDEGYYLYHFQQGPEAIGFNFYHLLISPIGKIFDHLLIGYRYINVVLVVCSGLFLSRNLSKNIESYWLLPLCSGLLYFNQISTLSYNSVVLVGGIIFLALVYKLVAEGASLIHPLLFGLTAFVVFSARFGVGLLILIFGTAILFLLLKDKKQALKYTILQFVSFFMPLSLFCLLYPDYFPAMFKYIKVVASVSHEGVLLQYFEHTFRYILRAVLVPLILLFVTTKWPKYQKLFTFSYLSWFLFAYVIKEFHFPMLFYYITGLVIAFTCLRLYEMWKSNTITKRDLAFTLLPIAFYLASVAGTNNNAMKAAPFYFIFLTPCLIFLIPGKKHNSSLIAICLAGITLICIYQNQFLKAYGSPPRSEQTYTNSSLPALRGILIDEKLEAKFRNVTSMLKREGFERKRDKIFVYANNPGFASYLEARTLGTSWNSDIYEQSDIANCYCVQNEAINPEAQLFVILTKELTSTLKKCIHSIAPLVDSRTLMLGDISIKK